MIDYSAQSNGLIDAVTTRLMQSGKASAEAMVCSVDPLLSWIGHLNAYKMTGTCDHCLDGVRSLILESIICTSAGLHRSAILAMRGQVDLVLTWIYFKDHPVEWRRVLRENEGYKLKKDVLEYLESFYPGFSRRMAMLKFAKKRQNDDPSRILSAHIHSVGNNTVPSLVSFSDIVATKELCDDCVAMQADVSEFVGDILISCYASSWAALPSELIATIKQRVGDGKFAELVAAD